MLSLEFFTDYNLLLILFAYICLYMSLFVCYYVGCLFLYIGMRAGMSLSILCFVVEKAGLKFRLFTMMKKVVEFAIS